MKQFAADLYAIVRLRLLYLWYCVVRMRPDLFLPHYLKEYRQLFGKR